jgi:hypothetical protein
MEGGWNCPMEGFDISDVDFVDFWCETGSRTLREEHNFFNVCVMLPEYN